MNRNAVRKWVIPMLGIVLLSAFPVVFMYFNNANEVDFRDAMQPLLVFCSIGLGMYLIFLLLTKSPWKASIIASLFMLAFSNFSMIEAGIKWIFPNWHYWHTLPTVFVVWLEVAILIAAFLPEDVGKTVSTVMCLVFGGLTLVNAAAGMPGLIGKVQADRQLAQIVDEHIQQTAETGQPNIYLLIFDEYANFPQMEQYYHYDNAPLKEFLTKNNFTISYDSHNESIYTDTVLTNLMNLDYIVTDTMSLSERELIRKQGKLFTEMRNHGYDVQIIEAGDFLGNDSPVKNASSSSATTITGKDFSVLIYEKAPLYPLFQANFSEKFEAITNTFSYFTSMKIRQNSSMFTIEYMDIPHEPFIADESGKQVQAEYSANWSDNQYYLGQYKYTTKIMIECMEYILQYDPNSIIILQSDHGARACSDRTLFMSKFPIEIMNNPLNAVYYRGGPIQDIEGLSSVNTMRTILSHLWNEQFELLEVP